jgi:hypothetical protein
MKITMKRLEAKAELRLGLVAITEDEKRMPVEQWVVGGMLTLPNEGVLKGPPDTLRWEVRRLLQQVLKEFERQLPEHKMQELAVALFTELAQTGMVSVRPYLGLQEVCQRLSHLQPFARAVSVPVQEALTAMRKLGTDPDALQLGEHEAHAWMLFNQAYEPQAAALMGPTHDREQPPRWLLCVLEDEPDTVHGVCLLCGAVFARELNVLGTKAWNLPEHKRLDEDVPCEASEIAR